MLVVLMLCGLGTAWGENETVTTYTFKSKSWTAAPTDWTGSKDGNQFNTSGTPKGVQVTTGSSGVTVTSPIEFSNVTKVVVTYSSSSKGVGSIAVNVGGTNFGSKNISKSQTETNLIYEIENPASGAVSFTVNCSTNSIGINSIAIHESSSGAPVPSVNASNVNVAYNATGGEIEFEINNPADGGQLTASTNADWLTLGTIRTAVPFTCSANEAATARTGTVSLTYTYGTETLTKDVTVTQTANPNGPGTQNNPYTVAQALDNAPASGNSSVVYVRGIVSSFWESNTSVFDDNSHRYYISDNGTTENQLLVYKGKGLNNKDFNENSNNGVEIGDEVIITGQLTTFNGTKELAINNYIVSLTRTERADADLSFGENTSFEINFGDAFTAPTLSNPHGLAVSYSSSNESVATVNASTGVVEIVGIGETIITASSTQTNEYKAGNASYTLKILMNLIVNPKNINSNYFVKVTSLAELEDGDAIIFVNEDNNMAMSTDQKANNRGAIGVTIEETVIMPEDGVQKIILVKEGNNFYFYTGTAGYLYAAASGNNYLKTTEAPDANAKALVTFDEEGNATIQFQGNNTRNLLKYNSNSTLFSCYSSGQNDVQIYKETQAPAKPAAPIIFHDGGEYEGALKVAMAGQGTIKYTLNGGAEQTYSAPINVSETTTITAWTESNGVKSDEVSKTFTIAAAAAGPAVEDNYYTIKNNGNNKYVNVAGRKTVTFVDETETAAGTVIRVKADDKGQVQILRSQGVDIPGYAEKAMNYVPKIVELIVDKLHAEGSGELLGENGLDAIMAKFKESFDYHLYLEEANGGYRIYGRTPSMQPVVDFYAENKANVDAKLPGLEAFINSAIDKVLQKTNGSGASILVPFSLQTVWESMGSTLTKPEDEASTAKFYEEVLSSEANVWNFAYETAMIYWTKLKDHDKFKENLNKLGDYAKYIDKVENIRPNFKYYIVQKDNQLDFISQGNSELDAAFTTWTLAERTDFNVTFNEDNLLNGKYYTTLYTDFAYTLPEGVKAYKVTKVSKAGVAVKKELTTVPAQTPVLLEAESADAQTLTLSTEEGTAPTDNLLKGSDFLINEYTIKTAQIESLFDLAKEMLGDSYETYMKEYEHLMLRNSGTVNNKYFFGLDQTDLKSVENVRMLNLNDAGEKLGFYSNWTELEANRAFIVDSNDPVKLFMRGDVNRDGEVDINDVTATVDIVLRKATPETHSDVYDFEAADANENGAITIDDVVIIVNMVLGK